MFEASKAEIQNNPTELDIMRKVQAFEESILTGKHSIVTNYYWLRSLATMAEKQGKSDWVEKYRTASDQLSEAYAAFKTTESEMRISRQRNLDLEIAIINKNRLIAQMQKQIENLSKGL